MWLFVLMLGDKLGYLQWMMMMVLSVGQEVAVMANDRTQNVPYTETFSDTAPPRTASRDLLAHSRTA